MPSINPICLRWPSGVSSIRLAGCLNIVRIFYQLYELMATFILHFGYPYSISVICVLPKVLLAALVFQCPWHKLLATV
jgi:hypothetical protein